MVYFNLFSLFFDALAVHCGCCGQYVFDTSRNFPVTCVQRNILVSKFTVKMYIETVKSLRDNALAALNEFSSTEVLIILGTILLLAFLLAEVFDWTHLFSAYDSVLCQYGYGSRNGPATWKCLFPHAKGEHQSPINVTTNSTVCVPAETFPLLVFSPEYQQIPDDIKAVNDGHSVTVYACWNSGNRPYITGGPCCTHKYTFLNARFRWGPNDDEGSEHTIDSIRYAMEIQCTHIKADMCFDDLTSATQAGGVVIISYLYQVTPADNPFLAPLITAVKKIRSPFLKANVEPMPLAWIMPPFASKYFMYHGSLTYPPCTEGVKWIIQSEPLSISSKQLKQFRKLMSTEGILESNTRPVQCVNLREIFFFD